MFRRLDDDIGVATLGVPVVDGVGEDTDGLVQGQGFPAPQDFDPFTNIEKYTSSMLSELIRRMFRRKDIFLSDSLATCQFPIVARFSDTAGPENIKPLELSIPALPGVAKRRLILSTGPVYCHEFNRVEAYLFSTESIDIGMELSFTDGSHTDTLLDSLQAGEWTMLTYQIPVGNENKVLKYVKLGPQAAPATNMFVRVCRVSMRYTNSVLPAPVLVAG